MQNLIKLRFQLCLIELILVIKKVLEILKVPEILTYCSKVSSFQMRIGESENKHLKTYLVVIHSFFSSGDHN